MLRAICASSRMCKISMENILSSSQTCTPKLAASPLAPEFSRSYSIVSLSGWTQSPALGHLSVLTRPCCQQNIFALQVSCCLSAKQPILVIRSLTVLYSDSCWCAGFSDSRYDKTGAQVQRWKAEALLVSPNWNCL